MSGAAGLPAWEAARSAGAPPTPLRCSRRAISSIHQAGAPFDERRQVPVVPPADDPAPAESCDRDEGECDLLATRASATSQRVR